MKEQSIIQVNRLTKSFKSEKIIKGLTFDVKKGEIFSFIGGNGSGKTTVMNMLLTMLPVSSGSITIDGFDVDIHPHDVRKRIGSVFQEHTLDEPLTVEQNLKIHGKLYGMSKANIKQSITDTLELFGLSKERKTFVYSLSAGQKRKIELARALMHNPKILFLDEPTAGLDFKTRKDIWKYIYRLREEEGTTIFLTTHFMDEVERSDRVAILKDGKIVKLDTPSNLKNEVAVKEINFVSSSPTESVKLLKKKFPEINYKIRDNLVFLKLDKDDDELNIVSHLHSSSKSKKIIISKLNIFSPTMENVFYSIVGKKEKEFKISETAETTDISDLFNDAIYDAINNVVLKRIKIFNKDKRKEIKFLKQKIVVLKNLKSDDEEKNAKLDKKILTIIEEIEATKIKWEKATKEEKEKLKENKQNKKEAYREYKIFEKERIISIKEKISVARIEEKEISKSEKAERKEAIKQNKVIEKERIAKVKEEAEKLNSSNSNLRTNSNNQKETAKKQKALLKEKINLIKQEKQTQQIKLEDKTKVIIKREHYRLSVITIFWRDVAKIFLNKSEWIKMFVMPIIFVVLVGAFLSIIPSDENINTWSMSIAAFIPTGIGTTIVVGGIFQGISLIDDVQRGYMKEMLISPIRRTELALGKVMGGSFRTVIRGTNIFLIGLVFPVEYQWFDYFEAFAGMLISSIAIVSISMFLATKISDVGAFRGMTRMVTVPLIFFNGMYMSFAELPDWLTWIILINPATYSSMILEGSLGMGTAPPTIEVMDLVITVEFAWLYFIPLAVVFLSIFVFSFRTWKKY